MTDYITIPTATDRVRETLLDGERVIRAELTRGDAHTCRLLGVVGAVLAGMIVLEQARVSLAAVVLLHLAALPTTAAVALLLWGLRRVPASTRTGAHRWARFAAAPDALLTDLSRPRTQHLEDQAHHLAALAARAVAQDRRTTVAVQLLLVGLSVAALALLTA